MSLSARQLEDQLGVTPGSTLTALVRLAEQVSPAAPWSAFRPLWLELPWLKRGVAYARRQFRSLTPVNVHPFAETGGDGNHFGFLLDGDLLPDARPVVFVPGDEPEDATEIVAPNLAAFLGLVAVAFAEVVSRRLTDSEWASIRREWYGEDPARLAEMERLADLLCTIPGVARPTSPSAVANAWPHQRFSFPAEEPPGTEVLKRGVLSDAVSAAHRRLLALGDGMVDGRVLAGDALMQARQDATRALTAALSELAAYDRQCALDLVASWRTYPSFWKLLARGVAGDLETLLAASTRSVR